MPRRIRKADWAPGGLDLLKVRALYSPEQLHQIASYFPGEDDQRALFLERALGSAAYLRIALYQFDRPTRETRKRALSALTKNVTALRNSLMSLDHDTSELLMDAAALIPYPGSSEPPKPAHSFVLDSGTENANPTFTVYPYGEDRLESFTTALNWLDLTLQNVAKTQVPVRDGRRWHDLLNQPVEGLARLWKDSTGQAPTHHWNAVDDIDGFYEGEFRGFVCLVLNPIIHASGRKPSTLTRWLKKPIAALKHTREKVAFRSVP